MTKTTKAVEVKKQSVWDLVPVHSRLVPIHPTTFEPMDTYVEIAGADSDEFRKALNAMIVNAKQVAVDETKLSELEAQDLMDMRGRELAGRCIVGWDEESFGAFSTEKAVEAMHKLAWLFVQVKKFIDDRENFYKA